MRTAGNTTDEELEDEEVVKAPAAAEKDKDEPLPGMVGLRSIGAPCGFTPSAAVLQSCSDSHSI